MKTLAHFCGEKTHRTVRIYSHFGWFFDLTLWISRGRKPHQNVRNSHILTPRCSRLHSIFEMRKVDAISIHVGFFLPEACSHWYFLQVRSNATNRNASYDEPMCRKKPTNINIAIVFRISIILWSRLHLLGQNVRDSHILVGVSPPIYP